MRVIELEQWRSRSDKLYVSFLNEYKKTEEKVKRE